MNRTGISDRGRLGSPTPLPVIVILNHYYLPSMMPIEYRRLIELIDSCKVEYINLSINMTNSLQKPGERKFLK